MKMSWKILAVVFTVGSTIMIAGLLTGIFWSSIYNHFFESELSLSPKSTTFKMWEKTPIPMYLKIYMFNWTNPGDFNLTNGIKPNFVEMGPYVFSQVDYKVNKVWNDNGTVTYQRRRIWHFEESISNGSLSDEVTNVDPVVATVAYTLRQQSSFFRDIVNRILLVLGHRRHITRTVGELLFDGYNDTMLFIAHRLNMTTIPYTKFGWFYGRNGSDTYDGTFNIRTGVSDLLDMGMLQEWNFKPRSNYSGDCGLIKGSNGELWPPLPKNKTLNIFVSDICTDLELRFHNVSTFQGLTGNRYISDETMFDNGTRVPSRSCYYNPKVPLASGMLNVSTCKYGAPAFVSLPHFYLGDPSYGDAVTGMSPDKLKHEMSLVIEPTTGVPMEVRAQMQLNLMVQPDVMGLFQNVNKTYMPMFWFSQEASLTSEYADKVKFILTLPKLGVVTAYGIAAIGGLLFCIGIFLCVRRGWQGEERQVLLPRNENYDSTRIHG